MKRTPLPTLLTLLLALPAGAADPADDGPRLRHDPFRRPGGGALAPVAGDAAAPVEWQPRLRGVLLSGPRSLANVDGQMVAIGERLDGHRLLSVTEYQAVFEKDGRRVTLDMRRPPRESRP